MKCEYCDQLYLDERPSDPFCSELCESEANDGIDTPMPGKWTARYYVKLRTVSVCFDGVLIAEFDLSKGTEKQAWQEFRPAMQRGLHAKGSDNIAG